MLHHFLKYQTMNLVIKISSVYYHEQNFSLLFYLTLQENMSLYQKSSLEYDMSHFIKISFLWLLSTRSHSACYAIKWDHFFLRFCWQYFLFDHSTFFLAISFITNEHMSLQYSCHVFQFVKLTWQSDLNMFS